MINNDQLLRSLGLFNPSNMTPAAWHHSLKGASEQGDSWFVALCKDVGEKAIGEAVESMAKALIKKDEHLSMLLALAEEE